MSEPHSTTGKTEEGPCDLCGAKVTKTELVGLYEGRTSWSKVPHKAPCGAPCLGGGVNRSDVEDGKFEHWTDGIHGWRKDNDVRVCPNGCSV